jgi:hypothetical protein
MDFAACEYHNLLLISSLDQLQTKLIDIVGSTCKEAGTKYAKDAIRSLFSKDLYPPHGNARRVMNTLLRGKLLTTKNGRTRGWLFTLLR